MALLGWMAAWMGVHRKSMKAATGTRPGMAAPAVAPKIVVIHTMVGKKLKALTVGDTARRKIRMWREIVMVMV